MLALQDLGTALVELTPDTLAGLDLPENLAHAVREAQRIRTHEGRRRQMQYIGKLMRTVDAAPIQAALARLARGHHAETAQLHALERWRDDLLADEKALERFAAAHPISDDEERNLRQLIRRARSERAASQPPKSARQLFQELKAILAAAPASDPPTAHDDSDT